jgi:hypothetical protein
MIVYWGALILIDLHSLALCLIIDKAFYDSKVSCEFSFAYVLIHNL